MGCFGELVGPLDEDPSETPGRESLMNGEEVELGRRDEEGGEARIEAFERWRTSGEPVGHCFFGDEVDLAATGIAEWATDEDRPCVVPKSLSSERDDEVEKRLAALDCRAATDGLRAAVVVEPARIPPEPVLGRAL